MGRRPGRQAFGVVAILGLALLTLGMSGRPSTPRPGTEAPNFVLPDLSGQRATLDAYRGKPLVVHFWASWCAPCRRELPEIEAAYGELQNQGFVVLGLNAGEDRATAEKFAKRLGLTFPILLDKKWNTASTYGVVGLPITFFVDRNGNIVDKVAGGTLTRTSLTNKLRDLHMIAP